MNYQTSINGQETTVELQGRLDAASAPDFDRFMAETIAAGATNIALVCRNLKYISSAGLRSVLIAAKKLQAHQGRLVLVDVQDMVKEVIEISGFSTIIQVRQSAEIALA